MTVTKFPVTESMLMVPRCLPESAWLGHIPFASWLVEVQRPGLIVELGTHRGASFLAFCQAVEQQGIESRVFAVDSWEGDEHAGFYGDEVYLELRDYQQRHYGGISELRRRRFESAQEYFSDGSIDLLHIDGLHTYEAVSNDFQLWLPKLSRRSVVLFHDICVRERMFGVWKFWDEVRQLYPSFSFTHTHGLGVLLVGDERQADLDQLAKRADEDSFALVNQVFDVLGRNIKNMEEIERVNAALSVVHAELDRVNRAEGEARSAMAQALEDRAGCQRMAEQQLRDLMAYLQELNGHATRVAADGIDRMISVVREEGRKTQEMVTTMASTQGDYAQRLDRWTTERKDDELRREQHTLVAAEQSKKSLDDLTHSLRQIQENIDWLMRPWWRRRAGK